MHSISPFHPFQSAFRESELGMGHLESLLKWNGTRNGVYHLHNHSVNSVFVLNPYTNLISFNVRQYRVRFRTLKLHRFIILIIVV